MNKLIIAICLIIVSGCGENKDVESSITSKNVLSYGAEINIVDIDSCEYIVTTYFQKGVNTIHKGNCKYCLKSK